MAVTDYLVEPLNKANVYKYDDAVNEDIRDALESEFPKAVKQWKNAPALFKGRNELETAKLIWLFLRNYCKYRRDPNHNQLIRLPSYFVNKVSPEYLKPVGDCKTFATFARSAYAAIYPDLKTSFKFTAYRDTSTSPSHVYTVVQDRNGNEIKIDGCYGKFNSEKKYTLALPLNFKTMRVTSLSGVQPDASSLLNSINDNASQPTRERIGKLINVRKELSFLQAERDGGHITAEQFDDRLQDIKDDLNGIGKLSPEQKAAKKKKRKEAGKKFGHGIKAAAFALGRGAFLALVRLNLFGLASKLNKLIEQKKIAPVLDKWYKMGGKKGGKPLLKSIEKGKKRHVLFLSKKAKAKFEAQMKMHGIENVICESIEGNDEIGMTGAEIAAVVASAVPVLITIITIMAKQFKGNKKDEADMAAAGQELVDAKQQGQLNVTENSLPSFEGAPPMPENMDMMPGNAPSPEQLMAQQELSIFGVDESLNALAPDFWNNLGQMANSGLNMLSSALQKKKPKLANLAKGGAEALENYGTGAYLRKTGMMDAYKGWQQQARSLMPSGSNSMLLPLLGVGVLATILVLKKK